MLPLSRRAVVAIIALIGLIAVPMAFHHNPAALEIDAELTLPIVLISEFILYFLLTLLTNARMGLATIGLISLGMLALRCSTALLGIALITFLTTSAAPSTQEALYVLAGDLIPILIQVVIVILAMPHLIEAVMPQAIEDRVRERMAAAPEHLVARPAAGRSSTIAPVDTTPSGGFIQVFSYDELTAMIRKSHGLEGFLVYNDEGLIVWHDMPMRMELDRLVARLGAFHDQISLEVSGAGLTRVRKILIEAREHLLFITPLNQNFGLVLVYQSTVSPAECFSRLAVIAKSAREFLQWKYPGLPITASRMTEKPLEIIPV